MIELLCTNYTKKATLIHYNLSSAVLALPPVPCTPSRTFSVPSSFWIPSFLLMIDFFSCLLKVSTIFIPHQKSADKILFSHGAGHRQQKPPPDSRKATGGVLRDFSFLICDAGFFRGFSRPLINHGGRGRSRRKRRRLYANGGSGAKSGAFSFRTKRNAAFLQKSQYFHGKRLKTNKSRVFSFVLRYFPAFWCILPSFSGEMDENKEVLWKLLTIYI